MSIPFTTMKLTDSLAPLHANTSDGSRDMLLLPPSQFCGVASFVLVRTQGPRIAGQSVNSPRSSLAGSQGSSNIAVYWHH